MKDINIGLSLLVPVYNEERAISSFFSEVIPVLKALKMPYELIFVNDGSDDRSLDMLLEQQTLFPEVKVINFMRNFGKEAALSAALDHCQGACAIPIDIDLQHPPSKIPEMIALWQQGYKNVLAVRQKRDTETFLKRVTSTLFYKVFNLFSANGIEPNVGDFRLIDRAVIDHVCALTEKNRFMKGLLSWPGGSKTTVSYECRERIAGKSRWNYLNLWNFAIDGITSFSNFPLKVWSYIGAFVALGSFIYAAEIIVKYFVSGEEVKGYASIMVTLLFLGGIQLISIGVLGEYLARIFKETKQRPVYLIEKKYGFDSRPS